MNDLQQGVVTLLKSAITGEKLSLPEEFSIEEAMPLIKKHYLYTMAYTGAVNCGISTGGAVMQQLFQRYLKELLVSERQMKEVSRICAAFDDAKIDYMPLKGCNMKGRYPKPELRTMGDADILIRMEQYDRTRPVMEQLGFTEGSQSDHELIWDSPALHLELHKRLISTDNADYYGYFGDGWRLASVRSGSRWSMTAEDEWVYLFTHFARHYRGAGIGCRHVVDLWVWMRTNPEADWNSIEGKLKDLRLLDFWHNVRRLIGCWFEDGEGDEITEFMSQFLMSNGSWGTETNLLLSMSLKKARAAGSLRTGRFRSWVTAIFPPASEIAPRYPILKRFPWLLPIVWPYRWIRAALFGRQTIRKRQKEMAATTVDQVSEYQQALNLVGLDFHFD